VNNIRFWFKHHTMPKNKTIYASSEMEAAYLQPFIEVVVVVEVGRRYFGHLDHDKSYETQSRVASGLGVCCVVRIGDRFVVRIGRQTQD